jgi:hypothetical protein
VIPKPKRAKRGHYYTRRADPIALSASGLTITGVWKSSVPPSPDRREEACRRVDELKGQRGADGKLLKRDDRIALVAKEYGFDFTALKNYKNKSSTKKLHAKRVG